MKNSLSRTSDHVPLIALAAASAFGNRRACFDPEGVTAKPPAVVTEPLANLRQEFSRLQTEATGIVDAATAASRDLTPEETTANDGRFSRMTTIKNTIDQRERFASLALSNPTTTTAIVQRVIEPTGRQAFAAATTGGVEFHTLTTESDEQARVRFQLHKAAINNFVRTGSLTHNQFTLTTGTGGTAGSTPLLPVQVAPPIVVKQIRNPIRAALAARGINVFSTPGAGPFTVPIFDDTANPAIPIAEDATTDNTADPAVSTISLGDTLYDSKSVWSSNSLLASLDYDLLGIIQPMLDQRIDRVQSTAWMTSLAAATVGVTAATATGISYSDTIKWFHSLPVVYRGSGVFIISDGLQMALQNLVDGQNRPIYQQSMLDSVPNTLLGCPVFVSPDLPAPAANAVTGIFIAAELMYVRDIMNKRIARYVNIPTRPDQFGLREFANGDFKFNPVGARTFKQAAA